MIKNSIKFTASLFFLVLLIFFLTNCSSNNNQEKNTTALKVVMVTDQAGLGDQGFNDSGWAGVEKAAKEFGLEANFIESAEQADYTPNLSIAAAKADVVVAMGFLMLDSMNKVADKHPDTKFVFIDGKVEKPNVASFDFKGEEASFLAGFIAAGVSRSGKIGIINGMDIPPVLAYEYGFRAGIKVAEKNLNRKLEVIGLTVGSFNDPVKGKSLARNLLSQGCDIILQIAGNSGIGVIDLFEGLDKPAFLISSDINIEDKIPGKVLTCVMKRFDNAVYSAIKNIVNNKFEPGYFNIGLNTDAVGITPMKHTRKFVNPDILKKYELLEKMVRESDLKIPFTKDMFDKFDSTSIASKLQN